MKFLHNGQEYNLNKESRTIKNNAGVIVQRLGNNPLFPLLDDTGKTDYRYAMNKEYCGYETPRYVLRFCDDYITNTESGDMALMTLALLRIERLAPYMV